MLNIALATFRAVRLTGQETELAQSDHEGL
jgi:hypothetical protein